jgi:hypothetical protein
VRAQYQPIRGSVDALAVILVGGRGDEAYVPLGLLSAGQPQVLDVPGA